MASLNAVAAISRGQYATFRVLFGAYLTVHFGYLAVFAAELFSNTGMLAQADHSPLFAFAPSLLHISDAPRFVSALTLSGVVAALAFALGRWHRTSAAWMLVLLISVFARNPLIANPALPYVGFMLLAHLFVPVGHLFVPLAQKHDVRVVGDADKAFHFPPQIFAAITIVLCLSYSYSGYTKLLSPSWLSGDTVSLVLQNPLARDWFVRDLVLLLPEGILQGLTWFILTVELVFAPLFVIRRLRPWLWAAMLVVQFGFLLLLRFPDLTIPMLLFHLLTFDSRWVKAQPLVRGILHYDGECGICHGAVRFALSEVQGTGLRFRPLQLDEDDVGASATWRLQEFAGDETRVLTKTAAVIRLLDASGGWWRLVAFVVSAIPRATRDTAYAVLARVRRKLAKKPAGLCPLGGPQTMARFILEP